VKDKIIIGRKDKADLPSLHLHNVAVKIDSGAYSCSIHCESVEEIEVNGKFFLEVVFLDKEHPKYTSEKVKFEKFRTKKVRSSTGYQQERYFVELGIILFDKEIITDFSLTKRNGLRNPILLGRKLLNKNFVIDTCFTNLSFRKKQQTLRKIKDTL
jgi:hypothetical protein